MNKVLRDKLCAILRLNGIAVDLPQTAISCECVTCVQAMLATAPKPPIKRRAKLRLVAAKKEMRWTPAVSASVLVDAECTYRAIFKRAPIWVGEYRDFTIAQWRALGAANAGDERIRAVEETKGSDFERACAAYPADDRHRDDDIQSVMRHLTGDVSPVVVFLDGGYTLLDGVHRLVAAFISASSIRAFVVSNDSRFT
jgi:hypothetical protein